jgi:hypothetical protein
MQTTENSTVISTVITTAVIAICIMYTLSTIIEPHEISFTLRHGSVYIDKPGINFWSPLHQYNKIIAGLNTDCKYDIPCPTKENYVGYTNICIENRFKLNNLTNIEKIYGNYYAPISKDTWYKSINGRPSPEDAMIYKWLPVIMTQICQDMTAYETLTKPWISKYEIIKEKLIQKVPEGVEIINVIASHPKYNYSNYILSVPGMMINWSYRCFACNWFS